MRNMAIVGITAEYHPFHNGHLHQLTEAKRLCGADYAAVILSGHFVQRGMPAVWDTAARAEAALRCGADAVFEIPAPFSTASAREYASFAAAAMTALGVDVMSCGAEHPEPEAIRHLAEFLETEPPEYRSALKESLKNGASYPEARRSAAEAVLSESSDLPLFRELLSHPNDLLALEYAMALQRQGSPVKFLPVKRVGNAHDAAGTGGSFASATAIREHLLTGGGSDALSSVMPRASLETLPEPLDPDAFSGIYFRTVLQRIWEGQDLTRYADVSPDLAGLIRGRLRQTASFRDLPETVKCRSYTHTRISRALTHIVLGILSEDMEEYKASGYAPYVRLVGFRRDAAPLLTELKSRSSVPILSKTADAPALLGTGTPAAKMLASEARASALWDSVWFEKTGIRLPEFPQKQMVIV